MINIDVKIRNPYNNCILRKIIYHQYLPMLIGIFDPLGAQTDRLRCEVCQNLILSPMNTGLLRPAVLQQRLPFTVLKLKQFIVFCRASNVSCNSAYRLRY